MSVSRAVSFRRLGPAAGVSLWPAYVQAHGLPAPETEVIFAPPRRYRADFVFRSARVIVECDGGVFAKGRAGLAHASPTSILRDMAKANLAQLEGWIYLRYTPTQLFDGTALKDVQRALESRR